jgi:hypothetical protein
MKAPQVHSLSTAQQGWMLSILGRSAQQLHWRRYAAAVSYVQKSHWLSPLQAVITELGGGQDIAAAKTAVQHALKGKLNAGVLQSLKRLKYRSLSSASLHIRI